jgi:rare lipoprotein A
MRKSILSAAFVMGLIASTCSASSAYIVKYRNYTAFQYNISKHQKKRNHFVSKILKRPFIYLTGIASYYGSDFNGRLMANGKPFYSYHANCAMRYVKLNTLITITNLRNGLSTKCIVADRGPFVFSRIIDVSTSVKLALRMGGLGYVKIVIPGY